MSQEGGSTEQRIDIGYFEGINSLTSHNVAKTTELFHMENARSVQIGSIEKRQGQTVLGSGYYGPGISGYSGVAISGFSGYSGYSGVSGYSGLPVSVQANYGLAYFSNSGSNKGLYRLTKTLVNPSGTSTLYYLNNSNIWVSLYGTNDYSSANILDGQIRTTVAQNNLFIVNGVDANRYISGADGTTITTSANAAGHLWNSPIAYNICSYKNRMYLADFTRDGIRYKTTVLRSSYPEGLVTLTKTDLVTTSGAGRTIDIVDNKYIYADSGANLYEVYRGSVKVCDLTVTAVSASNITATISNLSLPSILAADEIWVSGTYAGAKIIKWPGNPTAFGKDVKQYDTFKLAGSDNEPITMLVNIGNVLMVANSNAISSWNDYTLENFDLNIGCVSRTGYTKILGSLYFMHYTGVYATTGSTPKLISNKVERYITGATKAGKEACAAGKKGRSVFFTLGDVTLYAPDGSLEKVLPDVCLEYSITQENWFVHTNVKASQFETFIESTDSDRLEFTDKAGTYAVKEFLSGETDDGSEIFMRVDLPRLTFELASRYSLPRWDKTNIPVSLILDTERGNSIKSFVAIDEGTQEYYELEGKIDKGLSIIKIHNKDASRGQPPPTRLMSVSLRDSSKQLCKINRMAIVFMPLNNEAVQP